MPDDVIDVVVAQYSAGATLARESVRTFHSWSLSRVLCFALFWSCLYHWQTLTNLSLVHLATLNLDWLITVMSVPFLEVRRLANITWARWWCQLAPRNNSSPTTCCQRSECSNESEPDKDTHHITRCNQHATATATRLWSVPSTNRRQSKQITRSTQRAQTSAKRQHNRIVAVLPGSWSGMDSQIRIVMRMVTKM